MEINWGIVATTVAGAAIIGGYRWLKQIEKDANIGITEERARQIARDEQQSLRTEVHGLRSELKEMKADQKTDAANTLTAVKELQAQINQLILDLVKRGG